jgi:hypothetical protein
VIVDDGNDWKISHALDPPQVLRDVVCFRRNILREATYTTERPDWAILGLNVTDFEPRL